MPTLTTRLGAIEYDDQEVIQFPTGMLGFEELREYVFVPLPENPTFTWLQSIQDPEMAFLMVDPFLFFPEYEVDLSDQQQSVLQADGPDQVVVYAVVTVPPAGVKEMTANLLGPVAINLFKRRGLQAVLQGGNYTTRHLLFTAHPDKEPRAAAR